MDGVNLRGFLASQTGRRFTFRLINERPGFDLPHNVKGDLVQCRALEAAVIQGYEQAVQNIFEFITTEVDESAISAVYPSLDNEGLWDKRLTVEELPEPILAPEPTASSLEPLPEVSIRPTVSI